jgi:hypothetical protein
LHGFTKSIDYTFEDETYAPVTKMSISASCRGAYDLHRGLIRGQRAERERFTTETRREKREEDGEG